MGTVCGDGSTRFDGQASARQSDHGQDRQHADAATRAARLAVHAAAPAGNEAVA